MDQHQVNYELHDKEIMAVVLRLKEWDAELSSVPSFKVITDHKNLEYFTNPRLLGERQMRWTLLLGRNNMAIVTSPEKNTLGLTHFAKESRTCLTMVRMSVCNTVTCSF